MKKEIRIGGKQWLRLQDCRDVARESARVALSEEAHGLMNDSREVLFKFANDRAPVYGLNTQFGDQANSLDPNLLSHEEAYHQALQDRQLNLIRSHDCGLGEALPEEITRGAMLLRAHCLGQGHSGIRPVVVESLIAFLNQGIHPIIHRYGSIGASGDLIPLSAVASALCGEGEVIYKGKRIGSGDALKAVGRTKLEPEGREGLALINGTSFMTAIAALTLYDLKRLFPQMLSAMAMSLESLMVIGSPYHPLVHQLKRHKGEIEVNNFFVKYWEGSTHIRNLTDLRKEHLRTFQKEDRSASGTRAVQDCYSLRSIPQGFGTFKENLERATDWVEDEMNSINDNPIIGTAPEEIHQGANFMGYYVTEAADILKIDIAQASTWIHAILANLVHPRKNSGLPANLVQQPEVFSGFRPLQILAAALTVQNRKLTQSQQAFMLPTEGDNQDVNSLAVHAALDLREAVENLERLTAILFLTGAQALELRGVEKAGAASRKIHKMIRTISPMVRSDRSLQSEILEVIALLREEKI